MLSCALLGLAQPVQAGEHITRDEIYSALGLAQSARADAPQSQRDKAYSALANFVQLIGTDEPKPVSVKEPNNPHRQIDNEANSALREFAQRVGVDKPVSLKGQPKFAEADTAVDALRRFAQKTSEPAKSSASVKPTAARAKASKADAADATIVGEKVCMTCHSSHAAEFGKTLMGRIGKTQSGRFACENCHGPGSAHVKAGGGRGVGGIISFRPDDPARTAEENNAICLGCHEKGDRTYWNGSTHETRGLMCTNCHTIMKQVSVKRQLKTAVEVDTCFQCHKDRRAQMFRSSHMPMREGKVTCSNCHNPHGSATEALLWTDSINDTCYKCHAEKRGPYLFEHAPVRENCVNCHDPHGSVHESLLKIPRPRLCAGCHGMGHTLAGGPYAVQSMGRQCQNCHTAIHGTNSPSGALLHR